MGLFDRFRKRVTEVASEVDTDELSAEPSSQEAREALIAAENLRSETLSSAQEPQITEHTAVDDVDDEWEDLEGLEEAELPEASNEEWEEVDFALPA
jgi:hypothetical protein